MTATLAATRPDRLRNVDFAAHNAEVKELWASYGSGKPTARVPIILGTNTRYFIFNEAANPTGITFQQYINDPDVMFDALLRFARWNRFNLLQDSPLGLPQEWAITPDFQNFYEAAWFGCAIEYMDDQVPDTTPAFEDAPERAMEHGLPDPFGGLMGTLLQYYEHFQKRAAKEEFCGKPICIGTPWCGIGTDGPLTVACNLFGAGQMCEMALAEPERFTRLLSFVTDTTINRIKAWRSFAKMPATVEGFVFADDSVALISNPMYRQLVLPQHKRLCDTFGPTGNRGIHLCGDSTRHFESIRDELRVNCFDTGFPVDFGRLRNQLGPEVRLQGGPHVELLLTAPPQAVRDETMRILNTGVADSGRFLLREGNNLAPYTPLENTEAMYQAGREWSARRG